MKYLLGIVVAILLMVSIITLGSDNTVVYDCRIAEISPDVPSEVKNACRKMQYEHWKKSREIEV